ncbi:MAG: hypothetical protein KA105_01595 [Caulobacter sp.]|nr:hypothetical protein [Caulobacter sp.]
MIRRIGSLTLAALLAAAPAGAQDASLFGLFRSVCVAGLEPGGVAARASAQGFAPAKKTPKMGDMQDVKAFEKTVGERQFTVVAGRSQGKPRDGMPASTTLACGVAVKGKDEAGLAAARKWAAVPVSKSLMGVTFHAWRQGGGRTGIDFDDKAATKAALLAGDLNVLTSTALGGSTLLMLSKSRPAG